MRRQRRRDTKPELAVRRALTSLGVHYRLQAADLPGRPDVSNKSKRWAIFVHGCYWHQHPGCRRATIPKVNRGWWERKFEANRTRDEAKEEGLRTAGFRVLVVWECETSDATALAALLTAWLGSGT